MFGRGRNYMEKETIYIINKKMKKSSKYRYIMSGVKIFSDIILKSTIINPALDKQILKVLKKGEQKKEKIVKSNRGGFHSPYFKDKKIYQTLLKTSGDLISSCLPFKGKTNVSIDNLWIMKNKKNDWNVPHTHPYSNFSGIYYVKVPKKGGELFFIRNDMACGFSNNYLFIEDQSTHDIYSIKPEKGMLILFPSYLLHMVAPHKENVDRICVAFNILLKHAT